MLYSCFVLYCIFLGKICSGLKIIFYQDISKKNCHEIERGSRRFKKKKKPLGVVLGYIASERDPSILPAIFRVGFRLRFGNPQPSLVSFLSLPLRCQDRRPPL